MILIFRVLRAMKCLLKQEDNMFLIRNLQLIIFDEQKLIFDALYWIVAKSGEISGELVIT